MPRIERLPGAGAVACWALLPGTWGVRPAPDTQAAAAGRQGLCARLLQLPACSWSVLAEGGAGVAQLRHGAHTRIHGASLLAIPSLATAQ